MSISQFASWLVQRDRQFVWIEYEAYARRVFANASADWFRDPARYAATLIQARGVLATQCLCVDVTAPFLASGPDANASALIASLSNVAVLDFLSEALNALVHRFAGKVDLVLKFTAPWDLLGGAAASPDFDALDDVATALAGCMRRFADRPLAGLLLETRRTEALSVDEIDAYQPLISAARHYGWFTALALSADSDGAVSGVDLDFDALLWPQRAHAVLNATARAPAYQNYWHVPRSVGYLNVA